MQSPCIREASQACLHGCCPTPLFGLPKALNHKSRSACGIDFTAATASSLIPNIEFTNHESIPPLLESFSHFTRAYPQYTQTDQVDSMRAQEYYHLSISNHICLDYIGIGLFSHTQQAQHSTSTAIASSSSSPPPLPLHNSEFPFFDISYKCTSLNSQILYGGQESDLESAIRKRIMGFLNISENDYSMVFTANRTSAFKLLAESYPFQSHKRLLTVYDYESDAVGAMIGNSQKRGAQIMSADFSWPGMRIQSGKLRKKVASKRKKRKSGLFVFPLQSRMTGTRYSYLWMNLAHENGWHVVLDACALGPKDMDTLGLSLFQPDFLICSFFKVFGENPSGFGCLFVKKSSASILEASTMARSIGIVNLVPVKKASLLLDNSSGNDSEKQQITKFGSDEDLAATSSFSGPISGQLSNGVGQRSFSSTRKQPFEGFEHGETSELCETEGSMKPKEASTSEIEELENPIDSAQQENTENQTKEKIKNIAVDCRGLDHADTVGLTLISNRARCLINWLVNALMKLQHPHSEKGIPLVRIYGPKIKFDRGPAVAFNVFDWQGEKVEPVLVQKLADRSNISLSYGFLHNIWFSEKYEEEKVRVLETRTYEEAGNKRKERVEQGITVVTVTLGFLANFEDTYRLWAFVALFLDADFVEKERWRYKAINQRIVEV